METEEPKKRKRGRPPLANGSLGPSIQVTYRIPKVLYDRLDKIAESLFQPMPVILRAAAAEYAKNHRPVRWTKTGIEFKWPEDQDQPIEATLREIAVDDFGMEPNEIQEPVDTLFDTQVTPTKQDT